MSFYLNGNLIPSPTNDGVSENLGEIYHNRSSTNGTLRRYFYGVKWTVTLKWGALEPSDYANLVYNYFATGQQVTYLNTTSTAAGGGTCTFTGYPMKDEGPYIPGASLLRSLSVTIMQT